MLLWLLPEFTIFVEREKLKTDQIIHLSMKKERAAIALMLIVTSLMLNAREVIDLNRDWRFHRGDSKMWQSPDVDDDDWEVINVPHDFQISQPWVEPSPDEMPDLDNPVANIKSRLSARGFKEVGKGWYRKSIVPRDEWKDRRVLLDFEGIMLTGDIYLNGERVGGTDYGYLGTEVDITDLLKWGEPNVIAVRADTGQPENSRWYTGGGLFRDVKLIITDADRYFTRHPLYITTPVVSDDMAVVRVEGEIANNIAGDKTMKARLNIVNPSGDTISDKVIALDVNSRQRVKEYLLDSLTIASPELWSCENPALYKAVASVYDSDGKLADRVESTFGIRSIEYSPEFGFKLNGKKVLLKGIANHHTLGALGAAAYERAMEKRIELLKDFGFNHVRTSHNPYSSSFLDLCDRYGILVVDELYDKWLTQYAGGRKDWVEQWPHDVPEFIKRDRNHPSVIMWSLGNELQTLWDIPYADWGVTPYKMQRELLRRYDKTRPVTVAMHPRGRNQSTDSLPAPLALETDIAAYNYRYMYFPGDSRRFPWMMFYQSEANTSNMGPNYFDMDLDRVIGLAYWGMIDYLGESHGWPAKGWNEGVFDISLEPKPIAYFLRSFFKPDEPVVHIGIIDSDYNTVWNDVKVGSKRMSDHWNRLPGCKVSLYTYTNADEVELIVNGRSMGRRMNDRKDSKVRNRILWDSIPYKPGYVEAVAYRSGDSKPVARHRIETAGEAKRLNAIPDNDDWKADGSDLQHIRVEAVDSKGRRVHGADAQVKFTVDGPAEIVGVINGDITSEELTTGDTRRLYNGTATVILRSTLSPGKVTLTASSPGLKPTKTLLTTK